MSRLISVGIALLFAVGCGSSDSEIDPVSDPSTGGKGDQVGSSCDAKHNAWLINEFAPILCEDGPTCVGRVELDTRPTCQGEPNYETWTLVWEKHIFGPLMIRRNAAREAFMLQESPAFVDHERFVNDTAPTQDELSAHRALLSVPRYVEVFDYEIWIGRYQTLLHDFAFPLYSQANIGQVGDGRDVCGGPFAFEESGYNCEHEPTLFLNESEKKVLSLVEAFIPDAEEDGAFAAWAGTYRDLLASDTNTDLLHFQFPYSTEQGLAAYELDLFGRFRNLAPTAIGKADSEVWMGWYTSFLSTTDLQNSDQSLQLDLFEVTRPSVLVGLPAYESWLGTDILELGFVDVSDDPEKLERLLTVKPCARDDEELTSFQNVFDAFEPNAQGADRELASPAACLDQQALRD